MMRLSPLFVSLLTALLVMAADVAHACPTCKNALEDPAAHNLAFGFNTSILYMLATVFTLIGLIIWKIVREARKQPPA